MMLLQKDALYTGRYNPGYFSRSMDLRGHKAPPIPTSAADRLFDSFPWQICRFVLLPNRFPSRERSYKTVAECDCGTSCLAQMTPCTGLQVESCFHFQGLQDSRPTNGNAFWSARSFSGPLSTSRGLRDSRHFRSTLISSENLYLRPSSYCFPPGLQEVLEQSFCPLLESPHILTLTKHNDMTKVENSQSSPRFSFFPQRTADSRSGSCQGAPTFPSLPKHYATIKAENSQSGIKNRTPHFPLPLPSRNKFPSVSKNINTGSLRDLPSRSSCYFSLQKTARTASGSPSSIAGGRRTPPPSGRPAARPPPAARRKSCPR